MIEITAEVIYCLIACIITGLLFGLIVFLVMSRRIAHADYQHSLAINQLQSDFTLQEQQSLHLRELLQQTENDLAQAETLSQQTVAENRRLSDDLLSKNIHIKQFSQIASENEVLQSTVRRLEQTNIRNQTLIEEEANTHQEKINLLLSAREELTLQFKQLANNILEEKSKKFLEQNQSSIHHLLNPVQEKMHQFGQLVQESYLKEAKERGVLTLELKNLQKLNQQLNQEAQALTRALTGENNKTQGIWGEMILEKVLEYSGLRKNQEYILQANFKREEESGNKRFQPDALVYLPDNKCVVIDSKVSLNQYIDYINHTEDEQKASALKSHLESVRRHIKSLSDKNYHELPTGMNLDFVLMFIAVEPAYLLALQEDSKLLQDAIKANIMLVGPSNLLAVLRTISVVWRYENQNQNALLIAEEGGKLYDKFIIIMNSMDKLGSSVNTSLEHYNQIIKQMSEGKGNIISRMEKLRHLGVKANKRLPEKYEQNTDFSEDNQQ